MQFSAALRYPFRGPYVWPNLGGLLVCFLIPIAGPMVVSGYLVGVEKRLIQNLHTDSPRFDFAKFGQYLQRGVPPFLVALLASLILLILIVPIGLLFVLGMILMKDQTHWLYLLIPMLAIGELCAILLFSAVSAPLMFKAGLEGKIEAAFDLSFLKGYLKRVGLLMIGTQLLVFLSFMPLSMVFICIPLIGPYCALAWLMQVQTHLNVELYLTYLDRGGTRIPFTPNDEELYAFPVIPQTPPPPTLSP